MRKYIAITNMQDSKINYRLLVCYSKNNCSWTCKLRNKEVSNTSQKAIVGISAVCLHTFSNNCLKFDLKVLLEIWFKSFIKVFWKMDHTSAWNNIILHSLFMPNLASIAKTWCFVIGLKILRSLIKYPPFTFGTLHLNVDDLKQDLWWHMVKSKFKIKL